MSENLSQLKAEICRIGKRLYDKGFAAANDGNFSVRISDTLFLMTPAGICKGDLKPEMILTIDESGNAVDGESTKSSQVAALKPSLTGDAKSPKSLRPSSEAKLHLAAYKARPDINAIVHAHPPFTTAFAASGISLDKNLLPEVLLNLGKVSTSAYATPGTEELAANVANCLKKADAVVMTNHGATTLGRNLDEAYFRMETLEFYAKINYLTATMGNQRELPTYEADKILEMRKNLQSGNID